MIQQQDKALPQTTNNCCRPIHRHGERVFALSKVLIEIQTEIKNRARENS